MQELFNSAAVLQILGREGLTDAQRAEQVCALHAQALKAGYIAKGAAEQAQVDALNEARAEWERALPEVTDSDAYRALRAEFDAYRAMQAARTSEAWREVKPKFFETVYGLVERGEGAKPLKAQLERIRAEYEEYFLPPKPEADPRPAPLVLPATPTAPGAGMSLSEAMRRANAGERIDVSMIR